MTGRFLQTDLYYGALDNLDLSSDPLTGNRYAFAAANPVNFVELDGHLISYDQGGGGERCNRGEGCKPGGDDVDSCKYSECKSGWLRAVEAVDLLTTIAFGPGVSKGLAALAISELRLIRAARTAEQAARAAKASRLAVNKRIGDDVADNIASRYPGARREVVRQTIFGPRRLDVLTPTGDAIESKVGAVSLTKDIRRQIAKDVSLLRNQDNRVYSITWEFARNPATGKGGPTQPLLDKLRKVGIKVVIK